MIRIVSNGVCFDSNVSFQIYEMSLKSNFMVEGSPTSIRYICINDMIIYIPENSKIQKDISKIRYKDMYPFYGIEKRNGNLYLVEDMNNTYVLMFAGAAVDSALKIVYNLRHVKNDKPVKSLYYNNEVRDDNYTLIYQEVIFKNPRNKYIHVKPVVVPDVCKDSSGYYVQYISKDKKLISTSIQNSKHLETYYKYRKK